MTKTTSTPLLTLLLTQVAAEPVQIALRHGSAALPVPSSPVGQTPTSVLGALATVVRMAIAVRLASLVAARLSAFSGLHPKVRRAGHTVPGETVLQARRRVHVEGGHHGG
ncbi:hypothetical protein, partial [Sphingomonas bacterium]|uniref:hypothetical protein n=1 Tax=Sphingomonas bacterium TaxID=1895847 RepID=UPI001C2D0BA9